MQTSLLLGIPPTLMSFLISLRRVTRFADKKRHFLCHHCKTHWNSGMKPSKLTQKACFSWDSTVIMWYGDSSMTSGHWARAFRFQCMPSSQNTNICNIVQRSLVRRIWSSPGHRGKQLKLWCRHSAHGFLLIQIVHDVFRHLHVFALCSVCSS